MYVQKEFRFSVYCGAGTSCTTELDFEIEDAIVWESEINEMVSDEGWEYADYFGEVVCPNCLLEAEENEGDGDEDA